LQGGCQAWVL